MIELLTIAKTPAAEKWLRESDHCLIHSVFGEACNLVNESGKILSMVNRSENLGPFAVQVALNSRSRFSILDFNECVDLSTAVEIDNDNLWIGSLRMSVDSGNIWDPHLLFDWPLDEETELGFDYLEQTVKKCAPEDSLVSPILFKRYSAVHHELANKTWLRMKTSIQEQSTDDWQIACRQMAGLGPGLTPSGDDFLIGLIIGLKRFVDDELAKTLTSQTLIAARARTNALSLAWIEAAASHNTAYLWHQLFDAIKHRSEYDIHEVVQRFMNTGHTSGADALAGFLACR